MRREQAAKAAVLGTLVALFYLLSIASRPSSSPPQLRRLAVQHVGPSPPGLLAAGGASAMLAVLPWDVLDAARAAATDKKQVMLAVANLRAVVTMLPTLLLSMRLVPTQDISRHLIVEVDSAPALQACRRLHSFCTIQPERAGKPASKPGATDFGTREYFDLNWHSLKLARVLLSEGYTVLNVDVDVGLMQNPFPMPDMSHDGLADFVVARDPSGEFCLGFIMFRPQRRVTAVLDWMFEVRAQPVKGVKAKLNEQRLFNMILGDSDVPMPDAAQGITHAELDSSEFMSLCDLDEERDALPDQVGFAKGFARRMQQEGGFQRLYGVHMNCCWVKHEGSGVPVPCKMAALSAVLQWQANYIASIHGSIHGWT